MEYSFIVLVVAIFALTSGQSTSTLYPPPVQYCSSEISAQCPPVDPSNPVYIAEPDDCSQYCECSGGQAILLQCPDKLLWDDVNHICNFPATVDCGNRTIPYEPETAEPGSCEDQIGDLCAILNPNVTLYYADALDCSKYCECALGMAFEGSCPPGMNWDVDDGACESPEDVDCGSRPSYYTTTSTLFPPTGTQQAGLCLPEISDQCPGTDPPVPVFLEDPTDCSKYCQCSAGTAYSGQCPAGLLWSEDDMTCESNVDCGVRPNPYISSTFVTGLQTTTRRFG